MAGLKYFAGIEAAQAETRRNPEIPLDPFTLSPLGPGSRWSQWLSRLLFRTVMPAVFFVLRQVRPNVRWGRLVIVTRAEDVRQVLGNAQAFEVPFALEMTELAGGTNSVLGVEGAEHVRLRSAIAAVLKSEDLADIAEWSRGYSDALLDASNGRIDVVTDLITRVATECCARYFGLTLADPVAFAQWTVAVSNLLFADPTGNPAIRKIALNGSVRVGAVLDEAIARVRAYDAAHPDPNRVRTTLVDRFVGQGILSDAEIRATLMGLATGFIPTNTLQSGNLVEELLSNRALMDEARKAAVAGDETALRSVLMKAARTNPALSPGQWRYVPNPTEIAPGTGRRCKVPADSLVLVAIGSALRDGRGRTADETPEQAARLIFGTGPHNCMGARIALAQMVPMFARLLARPDLKPAGPMSRIGVFPFVQDMRFTSPTATQTMIIVSAPVIDGAPRSAIEAEIDALGNPASADVQTLLDRTGLVHFASLSVIEAAPGDADNSVLLFELNCDGARDDALDAIAREGFERFAPVLAHGLAGDRGFADANALAAWLKTHALDLHTKPWGPIGIHYNGMGEFMVRDIARQDRLADFIGRALRPHFENAAQARSRPVDALTHIRRLIGQDSLLAHDPAHQALMAEGAAFQYALVRPSKTRLAISDYRPPSSFWTPIGKILASADALGIKLVAGLVWLVCAIGVSVAIDAPFWHGLSNWGWPEWAINLGAIALALVGGLALATLIATAVVTALALTLYAKEQSDPVDERAPDFRHVRDIATREDAPGYEQNHILAVMALKPGAFRKGVFAFALWGIKQSILYWFRPGFVVTMGTIHYAKWFRVPGTEQFAFMSNYDGSWESYLEDFITRAHWGQTAAWSNGQGFPRTRFLVFGGADDGDRFKRWVRRQQRPTRFWFSRFPHLTTRQVRNHALIEDGLTHSANATDAARWLACFGSAQRAGDAVETDEVQSVLFGGFGNLHHASAVVMQVPPPGAGRARWMASIAGDGNASGLPQSAGITFGDQPVSGGTAVIAFSARGLQHLGLGDPAGRGALASFPAAFNLGMVGRSRVLGDSGTAAPDQWLWRDRDRDPTDPDGADAVLILYGEANGEDAPVSSDAAAHQALVTRVCAALVAAGGRVLHIVPTRPAHAGEGADALRREHFGYRDGLSQPAIRGTGHAARQPNAGDLVEPGEFVLGYRNNQGFYPPALTVADETDAANALPAIDHEPPARFPQFGTVAPGSAPRDFGRNGSFLVIRQLDQDVDGFEAALDERASEITRRYGHLSSVANAAVDKEWVAAKLIGRWRSGAPLVGHVRRPTPPDRYAFDNDFDYGNDDPQGLHCPLGAHIRRTNPRDSQEPGDPQERAISNRHRLLRRGRSYDYAPDEGEKSQKGLLFMSFCADLERQFEFVQHSWANAPSFHGLVNEPDPLLGGPNRADSPPACFTIPTTSGPVVLHDIQQYVRLRAGGYFFTPSQSALRYLAALAK